MHVEIMRVNARREFGNLMLDSVSILEVLQDQILVVIRKLVGWSAFNEKVKESFVLTLRISTMRFRRFKISNVFDSSMFS